LYAEKSIAAIFGKITDLSLSLQPTYDQLLQSLKAGKFAPVYYLFGEEHYYIDLLTQYIEEKVLDDASKGFNQTVIYGRDADVAQVISAARRFPMMAPYQIIIIKEAQTLTKGLDDFVPYFEKPVPTTILVIANKSAKLDKRTKFYKALSGHVIFESKKIYQDKVANWIESYLKSKSYTLSSRAASIIADSLGNDLSKIANELEKLIINKQGNREITDTDIELRIGISREFNIFELINALAQKNTARVFHIAHHMSKSKEFSIIAAIINLNTFFKNTYIAQQNKLTDINRIQQEMKLNFLQAKDCAASVKHFSSAEIERNFRLLKEYDLKSKGVNNVSVQQDQLFKELLLKML
jgi:DNA polymerase-3 subunit delta